ncbi:hypothetical protein BDY24DRAFT_76297 [Mrakia frigida]|uniref:uncharacterized protein n=1 Tax=Mrakia frigida TaxID=29902 RepID=UPI003FCC110F
MILSTSSSSHRSSLDDPPRAPFTSFSNYSSSSSNTITPTSPRSPPSPLSAPEEDALTDVDHLSQPTSSLAGPLSANTLASDAIPERPPRPASSFFVLRGSRGPAFARSAAAEGGVAVEAHQPSLVAAASLGQPSLLPSLSSPSADASSSTPLPPPTLSITIPDLESSSSTSSASVAASSSQKNPLAHTYGLTPTKRRRRVKSVSTGDRTDSMCSDSSSRGECSTSGRVGRGGSLLLGREKSGISSSSDLETQSSTSRSSSSSSSSPPKKDRSSSTSKRAPTIPTRHSSLVGSPEVALHSLSPLKNVRSSSPSSYLDPLTSAPSSSSSSSRVRSLSAPNFKERSSSNSNHSRTSSANPLPSSSPSRPPNHPPQPDDDGSSCSCSTATTSSEDQANAGEIGPLTPGGPDLSSFPFGFEKDLSRVVVERNGKGKEPMQPSFPSSRSLAFEDSSEGESTEAFVDAREQSYEGGGAVVKEIVVREEAREIEKVSTVVKPGKVDKRVFKLWELVEGEVAYTEDLVTLVHIYLHHLFLLPSFTPSRRAAITRNTLELLMLHKRFSKALVSILREEGLMSEHGGNMEESKILSATRRVAEVFVQEADDFASYEEYCAGHDEALLVIRQVESTPEWISYERRCSNLARSRTRQTLTRLLSSPTASYAGRLPLPSATAPTTPISTSFPDDVSSRLMLRDLLIKPVQRICRYPLVLASLLGSQLPREGGGGELERALGGMKEVAQGVDEATRRKAAKGRTDVIIERMEAHPTLTQPILRSLDECVLVGSLDVIYQHDLYAPLFPPVKVRYLAAFLYNGYLLLCKAKKGKAYQASFFMPLKSVKIVDGHQAGADVLLPDSFRLVGHGYFYELATSGRKEKDIWLDALRRAKSATTNWPSKPPTSAPEIFPPRQIARRMSSYTGDLPTSISVPVEMVKRHSMPDVPDDPLVASQSAEVFDEESTPTATETPFPLPIRSRSQSSSLAVTSAAVPNPNNLFRRTSLGHREALDRSLADIFSESCSTARNLAQLDKGGSLYSSPSKSTAGSSIGSAVVSTVRRKMHNTSGSLSRRSSFIDLRPSSMSTSLSKEEDRFGEMTPKPTNVGITRTKSEIGFKKGRSSMVPLWTFEPQATTSESPVEKEEDDALEFGRLSNYDHHSDTVSRSRTESGYSTSSSVGQIPIPPPSDVLASELGKLLFPITSTSPDEIVPIHSLTNSKDKPPSSFKTMKESIKRRSSFVEGWSARSKSVPASPTELRRPVPLPLTISKSSHAPFVHGDFSPLTAIPPPLPPLHVTITSDLPTAPPPSSFAPTASLSLSNLPSSSPIQSSQSKRDTPPTSRPGLLRRSLSSLSNRRRSKSAQNIPSIDPGMAAHARRVSNSLITTPLPETALVSPIHVPGVDSPEEEKYDPTRPSRSRTSSSDGSSGAISAQSSDDGNGGGGLTITLKRRKSSLRWAGFRGFTPVHPTSASTSTTPP